MQKRHRASAAVMNILGLSGSLRAASINSMLLRATALLAPEDINLSIFNGLGELPLFNPDLYARLPMSVVAFHRAIADADAVLFASPEYAHGVTGTIKNALDWLVGYEPFASKIVAVVNASPRAHHADDALRETLRTMAAVIVESASISLPLLGPVSTSQRWWPRRPLPERSASPVGLCGTLSSYAVAHRPRNSQLHNGAGPRNRPSHEGNRRLNGAFAASKPKQLSSGIGVAD
jgi:chromate reductase